MRVPSGTRWSCSRLPATAPAGRCGWTSLARARAPGSTVTMARSSPHGSTIVCAIRVVVPPPTTIPSPSSSARTKRPGTSSPSGETSAVRSPSRAAATAVIAPPPGERTRSPANFSSPRLGSPSSPTAVRSRKAGTVTMRSIGDARPYPTGRSAQTDRGARRRGAAGQRAARRPAPRRSRARRLPVRRGALAPRVPLRRRPRRGARIRRVRGSRRAARGRRRRSPRPGRAR